MKNENLFFVIVFISFIFIFSGCTPAKIKEDKTQDDLLYKGEIISSENGVKYESGIIDILRRDTYVNVSVSLRNSNVEDQEKIISSLTKYDFVLSAKSKTGAGFNGGISESGFRKLLLNNKIGFVYLKRTGSVTNGNI